MITLPLCSACSCACSQAIQAGLEVPVDFLDEFTTEDATVLLHQMKTLFHVAGTVSPLVILNPSKWADLSMGREHLLTVGIPFFIQVLSNHPPQIFYALGNERPAGLREVEKLLWTAIMNIACGSSAEKELRAFLDQYELLKQRWEAEGVTDLHLNFFANSTHAFLCVSCQLNGFFSARSQLLLGGIFIPRRHSTEHWCSGKYSDAGYTRAFLHIPGHFCSSAFHHSFAKPRSVCPRSSSGWGRWYRYGTCTGPHDEPSCQ
jgi:hypothetical protein